MIVAGNKKASRIQIEDTEGGLCENASAVIYNLITSN